MRGRGQEPLSTAALAERLRLDGPPDWGVVLGSGFSAWERRLEGRRSVRFRSVEGMAEATVAGHPGRFAAGRIGAATVVASVGRLHLYEGLTANQVVRPVEVLAALGARRLLLTTAVGGLAPDLSPGMVACVTDHVNLTGQDPAAGRGVFPDASRLYDPALRDRLMELGLRPIVLAGVRGPSYETPSEALALRSMGADAVCMSTVLEVMAAGLAGVPTAAVAVVANRAGTHGTNHAEVLRAVERASAEAWKAVRSFLGDPRPRAPGA